MLGHDYERAGWVFAGTVSSVDEVHSEQGSYTRYTIRVTEVFKEAVAGTMEEDIVFLRPFQGGAVGVSDCSLSLREGDSWLFFLHNTASWPSSCTGSLLLSEEGGNKATGEAWLEVLRTSSLASGRVPDPWVFEGVAPEWCSLGLSFIGPQVTSGTSNHGWIRFHLNSQRFQLRVHYLRSEPPMFPRAPQPASVWLTVGETDFALQPAEAELSWNPYQPAAATPNAVLQTLRGSRHSSFRLQAEGFEPLVVEHALLDQAIARFDACREALESSER